MLTQSIHNQVTVMFKCLIRTLTSINQKRGQVVSRIWGAPAMPIIGMGGRCLGLKGGNRATGRALRVVVIYQSVYKY